MLQVPPIHYNHHSRQHLPRSKKFDLGKARRSLLRVPVALGLLQDLADEREDEEREDCAPDEGVDDHDHPPDDAVGGRAECAGDGIAGLAEEAALEDQEQNEMHHAQRHIGEQE